MRQQMGHAPLEAFLDRGSLFANNFRKIAHGGRIKIDVVSTGDHVQSGKLVAAQAGNQRRFGNGNCLERQRAKAGGENFQESSAIASTRLPIRSCSGTKTDRRVVSPTWICSERRLRPAIIAKSRKAGAAKTVVFSPSDLLLSSPAEVKTATSGAIAMLTSYSAISLEDHVAHAEFNFAHPFVAVAHREHRIGSTEQHYAPATKIHIPRAANFRIAAQCGADLLDDMRRQPGLIRINLRHWSL